MTIHVNPDTDALLIVDVQRDFCPGGALAVPQGDRIVPVINRLLGMTQWVTVATRDWHPPDHCSFKAQGGIWPAHCVADTDGAAFHPELRASQIRYVVSKAITKDSEAYSGFQGTDLARRLRTSNIRRVFVCGLATDYCVKATALDARRAALEVIVLTDAVRGVEIRPGDCAKALEEMTTARIVLRESSELQAEKATG